MPAQSPLHHRYADSDALLLPYGSAEHAVDVVGAFEEVGLEYAALRKSAVLFDQAHTATLIVRGADRRSFLNNMVTQKVIDLEPGHTRRSFWLSRKGRIDADLAIAARDDHLLIALDRHLAATTAQALSNYVFAEDCVFEDASASLHHLALHGPAALAILAAAASDPDLAELAPGRNAACTIAGTPVVADRRDLTGDPGLTITVPRDRAEAVYDALLAPPGGAGGAGGAGGGVPAPRPAGWFAINTARIEAGHPLFNVDFGPDNLPAESGVIQDRVDFRKGCYLGQEVVARMDARKARKQGVTPLRVTPPDADTDAPLPSAGNHVFSAADPEGNPVGVVTSSTVSPMLSAASIAFAMIKEPHTAPCTELIVRAEGTKAAAVVQKDARFWSR